MLFNLFLCQRIKPKVCLTSFTLFGGIGLLLCLLGLFPGLSLLLGGLGGGLVVSLLLTDPGLVDKVLDLTVKGDALHGDGASSHRWHLVLWLFRHRLFRVLDPLVGLVQQFAQGCRVGNDKGC